MFVTSYQPITPSRRRSASLSFWYLQFVVARKISTGFQRAVGRAAGGRRVVFSKGSVGMRRVFRVVAGNFAGLFVTSLIYEYQRDPQRSSALALIYNALGCWFYMPQTSNMVRLGYFRVWSPRTPQKFVNWLWPMRLRHYSLYSKVSYLRIVSSQPVKFAKSAGSAGTLLASNFYGCWAVIMLASGAVKLFSNSVFAHCGPIGPMGNRQLNVCKAGWRVNKGFRPQVRGNVKNANDHPNGGRNRSLACSRTPWGYTAKKSRPPRLKTKLKALAKRPPRRQANYIAV